MRPVLRHVASVAVAVALAGMPPIALAGEPPAAELSAADSPPESPATEVPPPDSGLPSVDEPPSTEPPSTEPPLDTDDEPESEFDQDVDDNALDHDADGEFVDDYQFLRDSPEARTARRWLTAGIAATATGSVLIGGAIAMAMTDPCSYTAGNNCFKDAHDRAVVTMGVPGGVLLAGGIAMTIVGALQRRRLWNNAAVVVVPAPNGLVVSGRF